jgi:hypothetical protein
VYQLAACGLDTPAALFWMAELGPWNYAIAFAFMITGLLLTILWRLADPAWDFGYVMSSAMPAE